MKIRKYQKGDEKEILSLDRRLETHPWNRRDLSNWYWKYTDQNPSGASFVWVAAEDCKILAHFAAVPYKIKVFDRELRASHSIGALVEEKYQNKGLLKFVGDKLFEDLSENGIPFTYGFPNDRSYGLHKSHMGYSDLIQFDNWVIQKSGINKVHSEHVGSTVFKKIDNFDDAFDELWRSCSCGYEIAIVRDKEYLKWRYLSRPDVKYYPYGFYRDNNLKGFIVLKLYQEDKVLRGNVLDIFARRDDGDTLSELINGGLNFFKEKSVDEATCWIWGNVLIEDILCNSGFERARANVPLVIRVNKDFENAEGIKNNEHWFFAMGDSTEIF